MLLIHYHLFTDENVGDKTLHDTLQTTMVCYINNNITYGY